MNDGAVTRRNQVDHLAYGGCVLITGNDQGAWRYLSRITGLIQECLRQADVPHRDK